MSHALIDRLVIARDSNIIRVDFRREPDHPHPKFPGGAAAPPPVLAEFDTGPQPMVVCAGAQAASRPMTGA